MTNIQHGLMITAIGMGLVFAVIIFLWGLMALMMKITSQKVEVDNPETRNEEADVPLVPENQIAEQQRRAAAAAVAVEIAITDSQSQRSGKREPDNINGLNPWQVFHRSHQLQQKNSRG